MECSGTVTSSSPLLEVDDCEDKKNTQLTNVLPSPDPVGRISIVGHMRGRDDNSSVVNMSYDDGTSEQSKTDRVVCSKNLNRCCSGFFHIFQLPFTDHSGNWWDVTKGLFGISIIGTFIGLSMPKSHQFSGDCWYGIFSSVIGYIYFLCWSVSFYPQVIMNYQRKTTSGLSPDFSLLNLMGFACYSIYTCCFYWSPLIREEYQQINGKNAQITVQSNDVAFALHAFVLCSVQVSQIFYYDGIQTQPLSKLTMTFVGITTLLCMGFIVTILVSNEQMFTWLDCLYVLAGIKLFITTVKYIPQVVTNQRRQSTEGWSVWNVVLDLSGGLLSLTQLLSDSIYLHDFHGITGNWVKFGLSFVSIFFDVSIFPPIEWMNFIYILDFIML